MFPPAQSPDPSKPLPNDASASESLMTAMSKVSCVFIRLEFVILAGLNLKLSNLQQTYTPRVENTVTCVSLCVDVGGGDSCLLLFLLCLVTVVISLGGTALYCALGDAHSSVCQDFSRNADFYFGQLRRGISHIQHWLTPGS